MHQGAGTAKIFAVRRRFCFQQRLDGNHVPLTRSLNEAINQVGIPQLRSSLCKRQNLARVRVVDITSLLGDLQSADDDGITLQVVHVMVQHEQALRDSAAQVDHVFQPLLSILRGPGARTPVWQWTCHDGANHLVVLLEGIDGPVTALPEGTVDHLWDNVLAVRKDRLRRFGVDILGGIINCIFLEGILEKDVGLCIKQVSNRLCVAVSHCQNQQSVAIPVHLVHFLLVQPLFHLLQVSCSSSDINWRNVLSDL
mmetsp:Transcript_54026/g.126159  ORF Transcript_54026/g.126159 Transcript_54026/m.126159 type:complete len:254 (-) Transcript_54026:120-881(-)